MFAFGEYLGKCINGVLTNNKIYKIKNLVENYYYLIDDDSSVESVFEPHLFKIRPLLKVKYIGDYYKMSLSKNSIYEVISITNDGWYRIIDETNEDYMFSKNAFVIIENLIDEELSKLLTINKR